MRNPKIVKRLITCQGSIQLVTALSVLKFREEEQKDLGIIYENYLVIYDLYAPEKQDEAFALFIEKMAREIFTWKSINYIKPQQLIEIQDLLPSCPKSQIEKLLANLIGTNKVDEIYLSRNWQFGNQLFINIYNQAIKVCYGDGIGFYFSKNSSAFFINSLSKPANILTKLKAKIRGILYQIQEFLNLKTLLKEIAFEQGYLFIPNIMDEPPPMPTINPPIGLIVNTFRTLHKLVSPQIIQQTLKAIDGSPVVVLLTSNFSEAGRMSLEQEIEAYERFLKAQSFEQRSILLIKPHPRDSKHKLQTIQKKLKSQFQQIILLADLELYFLPFEIFFQSVFIESNFLNQQTIDIIAVSSACLSIKVVFNLDSKIGFGENITQDCFYPEFVKGRLEHENFLKMITDDFQNSNFINHAIS
ncbi:hypothetical protein H6G64_18445 [Calothrix sp. FACHB-156]|nr:hypothetical protein [Calothrix sp. FACHB-156]